MKSQACTKLPILGGTSFVFAAPSRSSKKNKYQAVKNFTSVTRWTVYAI